MKKIITEEIDLRQRKRFQENGQDVWEGRLPLLTHMSLEDVTNLLDLEAISGTEGQLERLRRWIESVAENRGSSFVRENRRDLLRQWELHMRAKSKSCC